MPFAIIWGKDDEDLDQNAVRALTITAAAARIGVSEKTLKRAIKNGDISPCDEKLFNIPLVLEPVVDEYREQRKRAHF